MQKILIVGNVAKNVFLRLDERHNNFETDQNGTKWLDFSFDGSVHSFFNRVSVYSGASVSLEILSRFGFDASIVGTPATFLDGQFVAKDVHTDYRYILCQDDNISLIKSEGLNYTKWEAPTDKPDWIYVDASAIISPELASSINSYLDQNPDIKLAFYVRSHTNQHIDYNRKLIERADFVIGNTRLSQSHPNFAFISDDYIEYQDLRIYWASDIERDLTTRLTSRLAIAATILGALLLGKKPDEALLLARANVKHSTLNNTANISTLEQDIKDDYYRIENTNQKEKNMPEIEETAQKLMTPGKGILAADESGGSIHKKFESMNIPDDEQHRRDYRNLFFTTPDLEKYVSGVILFDETARQIADDGQTFINYLKDRGVISGIKVDQGLVNFENSDEKWTQGLDGLPERLAEYYQMGARFAKWRAAFEVTDHSPSDMAIEKNSEILAQYALDCQNANIVPIVEPELVYDGDYTVEQNIEYTSKILDCLFQKLAEKNINLKGCLLKCNMVLAGKRQAVQSTPAEVGRYTAQILRDHVPSELAGVVFLSGGQSVTQATENLQEVTNNGPFPWTVTFSYARALQDPALKAWQGDNNNADTARNAFRERLIANADALKAK